MSIKAGTERQALPNNDHDTILMDAEKFLTELARNETKIMGFLWSISPSSDVAEDLFQQTVLTMWQKCDQFEPGGSFSSWACGIAKRKALEFSRAQRKLLFDNDLVSQLADEQASEDLEVRFMRRQALTGCLSKLMENDRELVEACYRGDRTIKQVAEQIGRSKSSVYNSLARIRQSLQRCVDAKVAQEAH